MKHTSKHYFIQSKLNEQEPEIIGHSKDEETDEIYYLFLNKKSALELLQKEKIKSPQYQYRLVTETKTIELSNWE